MIEKKKKENNEKQEKTNILVHLFFILFGVACIIPFITIISASFSSETDLAIHGFSVLPKKVDFSAYAYLLENPKTIINAYAVTIIITVVGTFVGVLFMSMAAYCLARNNFRYKKILTFFIFFPTLFSGGMVPSYYVPSLNSFRNLCLKQPREMELVNIQFSLKLHCLYQNR